MLWFQVDRCQMGLAVPAMPQREGACGIRPDACTVTPFSHCGLWLYPAATHRYTETGGCFSAIISTYILGHDS